ncbi:MAG: hypothetical protein NC911_06430 [Candidatus Omnitrophica bacterium]|nr:hypothetical protein [Candidatus Omnitrophota bacterium]
MIHLGLLIFLSLAWPIGLLGDAKATLRISKDFPGRLRVFLSGTGKATQETEKFLSILGRDLNYSGYFNVSVKNFVSPDRMSTLKLEAKGYDLLCFIEKQPEKIRLVAQETVGWEMLFESSYSGQELSSQLSHQVADDLVLALIGRPGIAQSQICLVALDNNNKEQIFIVDYDGENLTPVTRTPDKKLFPRWLPGKIGLFFLSVRVNRIEAARLIFPTREIQVLPLSFLAGALLPNPRYPEILGVLSHEGNPEIYRIDWPSLASQRLTFSRFIDTSPTFSPDGEQVIFVSDRTGQPRLYLMTRTGSQLRPLKEIDFDCYSPDWSPDGTTLCFTAIRGGEKNLAIYDFSERKIRWLPTVGEVSHPSWAPNSRHLVYACAQGGKSQLFVLDVVSGEIRRLISSESQPHSPSWSR